MDGGHEAFGIGTETARVIAGSATATGGYLYFTKTQGLFRLALGAGTTFLGGLVGYDSISSLTGFTGGVSSGLAATATLGVIYAVRAAAGKFDATALFGRKA